MKKIVIAGGSGFIGSYLTTQFRNEGYDVIIISRQKYHVQWSDKAGITGALENSEWLINMAGRSVDCRYNERNRAEILQSRINTTMILGNAILECINPPKIWFNSSTGTIYRYEEHIPMTEKKGIIGQGFSVNVATKWEEAFFSFQLPETRQVALRTAIVLGKNGGAWPRYKNLARFGLGGQQGNGKQKFSWLHIEDLKNIIEFVSSHPEVKGAINCASPGAITNAELMRCISTKMSAKLRLPSLVWLLKLGALLIRTETELILKSRWVFPEMLLNAGYQFKFPTIESALDELISPDPISGLRASR